MVDAHPKALTPTVLAELERLLYQSSELGGSAEFERAFGEQQSLALFIRSMVGLDRAAAQKQFAQFLYGTRYNANQIRFVSMIIEHLRNGAMDAALLYESPYTDAAPQRLDGLFSDGDADRIIKIIDAINQSAACNAAPASQRRA